MADFSFKTKKTTISLRLEKENISGELEFKDLVFEVYPTKQSYINGLRKIGESVKNIDISKNPDGMDLILSEERKMFDAIAPGKWDEIFSFLDEDCEHIAELLVLMVAKIKEKGIESKKAEIVPEVPDGEEI